MSNLLIICIGLFLIIFCRYIHFFFKVNFLRKLEQDWEDYLCNSRAPYQNLAERKSKLKELLKEAKISNKVIPTSKSIGFGHFTPIDLNIIENFLVRNEAVASVFRQLIFEAIGYFKDKMRESFNPLFWLNLIVFLPRNILFYLGVKADFDVLIKLLQLIYWICMVVLLFFNKESVIGLISNIISLKK